MVATLSMAAAAFAFAVFVDWLKNPKQLKCFSKSSNSSKALTIRIKSSFSFSWLKVFESSSNSFAFFSKEIRSSLNLGSSNPLYNTSNDHSEFISISSNLINYTIRK